MIEATCHCGVVHLEVARAPEAVNECTCSICRRYGTLWAYYPLTLVSLAPTTGATDIYMWGDRVGRIRCRTLTYDLRTAPRRRRVMRGA
jgi:hypothetical protein